MENQELFILKALSEQKDELTIQETHELVKDYIGWEDFKRLFQSFKDREFVELIKLNKYKISQIGINRYKWLQEFQKNSLDKSTNLTILGSGNNVIFRSNGASISNNQINQAESIIDQIKSELEKYRNEREQEVQDLIEVLADIKYKIENKENVPKLTFQSFLASSSNFASIASLAITLGQIIGILPMP